MYSISRSGFTPGSIQKSIPTLGVTVVIAEMFYKFHSFTLEFTAALATWYALDAVASWLASLVGAGREEARSRADG